MGYVQGEARMQETMFPVTLEELIPADHVCRVIDAFVDGLNMATLGFERATAAETGRPGYDPRDLLKLYLYGYLQQVRSSRRLEAECRRNVELMWMLGAAESRPQEHRRVSPPAPGGGDRGGSRVSAAGAISRTGAGGVGGHRWLEVSRWNDIWSGWRRATAKKRW